MKKTLYILMLIPVFLFSQEKLSGVIYEDNPDTKKTGLAGANVYWLGYSVGVVTDINGKFKIPYKKEYNNSVR